MTTSKGYLVGTKTFKMLEVEDMDPLERVEFMHALLDHALIDAVAVMKALGDSDIVLLEHYKGIVGMIVTETEPAKLKERQQK